VKVDVREYQQYILEMDALNKNMHCLLTTISVD